MIYDKIENLKKYIELYDYELIKRHFLDMAKPNMEENFYPIDKDRIYARVMSYKTNDPSICELEAHDKYIDIQCTLIGAEGIDVYDRSRLTPVGFYDADKDVIFYEKKQSALLAHISNFEGYFTLLMPNEAHAPQQIVGECRHVKKFVIKYCKFKM